MASAIKCRFYAVSGALLREKVASEKTFFKKIQFFFKNVLTSEKIFDKIVFADANKTLFAEANEP